MKVTLPTTKFRDVRVQMYRDGVFIDERGVWKDDDGKIEIEDGITDIIFQSSDGSNDPTIEHVYNLSDRVWHNTSRELGVDGEQDKRGDVIRLPEPVKLARRRMDTLEKLNPNRRTR